MKRSHFYKTVFLGSLAVSGLFLAVLHTRVQAISSQSPNRMENQENAIYLPFAGSPRTMNTVFGMQMPEINDEHGLQQVLDAKSSWVRRSNLEWALVEQVEGQYDWDQSNIAALEEELIQASSNGMEVILVIHQTPVWAQKIPGYSCGPIKTEKITAFANFVFQAVSRYSAPPYDVKYWQIWNEPEADPAVVRPTSRLGCWGDPNDPFFGGGYYGEVVKEVYPKLKEANPTAKLVLGGLLLACSPDIISCPSPSIRFFEGILNRNGAKDGGRYLDLIAFHSYDHYYGELGHYGNANWNSSWDEEGPAIASKAFFIRKVMRAYGVDLPLMVTEAALLCGKTGKEDICLKTEFEKTKAYYVAQLYGTSLAEGFETTVWYHILGWRKSELLDKDLNPLLAFDAYKFAREELQNGTFQRRITDYKGLVVYEFNRSDRIIWLIWSQVGEKKINLPNTPLKIWDVYGNPIEKTGHDLIVTLKPLYLEWRLP